jgi:hypothetical protein
MRREGTWRDGRCMFTLDSRKPTSEKGMHTRSCKLLYWEAWSHAAKLRALKQPCLSGINSQAAIHGAVTKTMTKSNALAQY